MKIKNLKWLGLLLISLTGCYDFSQFDNIAVDPVNPSYVFPLMQSKITFKELSERTGTNTMVEQHPGSDMYFVEFRDTVDVGLATDLFTIPSVTFNNSYTIPGGMIPGAFPFPDFNISSTFDNTYNSIAGAELKSIDLSAGTLQISITNNINHNISGNLTITSLKDKLTGNPVVLDIPSTSSGVTYNHSIDITGDTLDLQPSSAYNNINYTLNATISYGGSPSFTGNSISVNLSINNPNYSKITGKVNYSYTHPDESYSINLFASTIFAEQHLAMPKFKVKFRNSFGIPSEVDFTRFEVANNSGATNPLVNRIVGDSTLLIGSPNLINHSTESQSSALTVLWLDSLNSNIADMFDIAPKSLSFGATFNLGDASSNHDYFIRSDSKFQLQSEIEIPLLGWVITNEITDTILNVDWPDLQNDLKLVDDTTMKVKLKFKFSNELPLNMYLQIKFYDDGGNQVAQLFDSGSEWFIKSSPVNASTGESSGTTTAYSYVTVDKAKYDEMKQSQDMVVFYKFTTGGNSHQNIKILSTNSISIDMSMEATGTVDTKNL